MGDPEVSSLIIDIDRIFLRAKKSVVPSGGIGFLNNNNNNNNNRLPVDLDLKFNHPFIEKTECLLLAFFSLHAKKSCGSHLSHLIPPYFTDSSISVFFHPTVNSMESKEDVQSDGSYELVNFDDYASETERLDAEDLDFGSKDLSDASSYDLLCSDMSDTLVLTNNEAFYNTTVSQDTASDEENQEQEDEEQKDVEDDMGFGDGINSDSEVQLVLVNKVAICLIRT
ncbi:uncharacterized protein LOC143614763 [Bidens hawaiensis]|uniref:uncharacterized protein LOC143614763 n=1 Tax=Bidens hawaiensis TaxID=980011 RepID=UPI004048FC3E